MQAKTVVEGNATWQFLVKKKKQKHCEKIMKIRKIN